MSEPIIATPASPVITMISIDALIERQNDAIEAAMSATRSLFQHALDTHTPIIVHSPNRNLHLPFDITTGKARAYSFVSGNYTLHYEEIVSFDYDPETGSLAVNIH